MAYITWLFLAQAYLQIYTGATCRPVCRKQACHCPAGVSPTTASPSASEPCLPAALSARGARSAWQMRRRCRPAPAQTIGIRRPAQRSARAGAPARRHATGERAEPGRAAQPHMKCRRLCGARVVCKTAMHIPRASRRLVCDRPANIVQDWHTPCNEPMTLHVALPGEYNVCTLRRLDGTEQRRSTPAAAMPVRVRVGPGAAPGRPPA